MIDLKQEKYLQQLVESELSFEEENDAIMQCEQDSSLWRSVALALLERRRIENALAEFEEDEPPLAVTSTNETDLFVAGRWTTHGISKAMMAVAASLLLSIGAGGTFGWHFGNKHADVVIDPMLVATPTVTGPVLVQVAFPNKQTEPTSPVYSFAEPILNLRARSVLRDAGFEVEEVASWHLVGDGQQQQAVPSREVRLTSTRSQ